MKAPPTESAPDSEFTLQEYFTPTKRSRLRRFPHLASVALRLVVRAARRELIEVVLIQASLAVALAVQLLVLRSLLSGLIGGREDFAGLLPELIALSVLLLAVGTAGTVLGLRSRLLGQLVAKHAIDAVIRTATRVDLITYDTPGFHDRLQRAQMSAAVRPAMMVQELITALGGALSIVAIAATLLILQPLFCVLILVAYIPVWVVTNRAGQLSYRQTVEQTERERRRQYLYQTLTTKPPAQEIRAFGLGDLLADRQDAIYTSLLDELRTVLYRRMRLALIGQALTAVLGAAALAVLVWFVTSGRISVAAAGTAGGAMVLLSSRLHGMASSSAGLYENSLYLEDYVSFVNAGDRLRDTPRPPLLAPSPTAISAEGISFTYPSRSQRSLEEVSLELRSGEVVALVGENGSGKTTFAKLLAGLYRPEAGSLRWDGVDIAGFDPASLQPHISLIFQDFMRYLLPAHDNIALGDPHAFTDRPAVERAARAAGIHEAIDATPHGYETILGPAYYGGTDLSGGQWQRIALARLYFRDASIVILDEPAASLDPKAEAELYASMRELFAERAVLLISHRFASARSADRIYVMRNGRVHERGTHEELVAAGGYYAELYELQARQYRD